MKPKFALRHFLAIAGSSILAITSSHAATLYWDGNDTNANANGGTGTWDASLFNWDTLAVGGTNSAWTNANLDTAVFGGTASTSVALGANIDVGGLQFNTTGYGITSTGFSLNFADTVNPNTILFNNIAAATITGPVVGAGNVVLSKSNPATAGILTLNGTSAGGWTGSTTINAGMTMSLSGLNQALKDTTTGITLNGGGITLTSADDAAQRTLDRVSDTTGITSNGGTITYTTTAAASANAFIETIGSVTLNKGQLNLVQTLDKTAGSQTLALAGLSQTGTAAITFSNAGTGGPNITNDIIRVNGITTSTTSGQIIGPWATVGTTAASQTDYAVYNSDGANGRVVGAGIAGSTQDLWTNAANAYTMSSNQTLTGTRTITALRNATGAGGTLTLATGANLETYGLLSGTATLAVNAGTGGVLTTPTGGGNLFITTGGNNITIGAPINDNGGAVTLVKSGGSTLTLSSTTSNFSGGIVLNAGTLAFNNNLNLGSGGGITVNGASSINGNDVYNYARTLTLNEGGALSLGNGFGVTGVFSGNGTLNVASADGFVFSNSANNYTGAITSATAGTTGYGLEFASIGDTAGAGLINLVGGSGTFRWISASGSTTTLTNRQFALSSPGAVGSSMTTISALGTTAASNLVINKDLLVTGAAGARALRLAGTNLGNNTFAGIIADGTEGGASVVTLVKDQAGLWILSNDNTYTGSTIINASGGTLQIGTGGTTGSISNSGSITLTGGTLAFNRSDNLVQGTDFATGISGAAGGLTKLGAGDLTLNSANTFGGLTTITAGRILMTHALALQNSAYNTTGSNGSTIGLDVTSGVSSGNLTLGGLSGAVNLGSAITAGYTGSVSNLTLNPQTGVSVSYSGLITNATVGMDLTKTGGGTQTLTTANAFTGSGVVTVSAGTLSLSASQNFSGGLLVNGGKVFSGVNNQGFTGGITVSNGGILEWNVSQGTNSFGNNTNALIFTGSGGSTSVVGSGGTNHTYISGQVDDGAVASLDSADGGSSATTYTFSNGVSGDGELRLTGGGNNQVQQVKTINLNNSSTFTGILRSSQTSNTAPTNFNFGALGDGGKISQSAGGDRVGLTVNYTGAAATGATFNIRQLEINGGAATYNSGITINSNGTGALIFNSDLSVTANATSGKNLTLSGTSTGFNNEFNGLISNGSSPNAIGLQKTGASTWIVSDNNSYTGATAITGGTLLVNGDQSLATGNVTVASGSTLGGTGTIGGATTINGRLSPGSAGIEDLNFSNNVTWNGGASASANTDWFFELGASNTADLIDIVGDFDKGTGSVFRFDFMGSTAAGTFALATWTGSTDFNTITPEFTHTNYGGLNPGSFSITGSTLYFTAIPEPSTALGGLLLIAGLLRRRRKTA
jgi:fibronectin-binding autotransporter adhesin